MELKIDPEQVSQFVSEALLRQLDSVQRETLIAAAINYLITPEAKTTYGGGQSPLQLAFNNAIRIAAQEIINKDIETNAEIQQKLKELIVEAVSMLVGANKESIAQKMSDAIYRGLTENRY